MDDHPLSEGELQKEVETLRQRVAELQAAAEEAIQVSAELRDSEERYRRMVASISSYVYTVRIEDGVPVETVHSEAAHAVTGYSPAEYAASPLLWIAMVHPDDQEAVRQQAQAILAGEPTNPLEHRIVHRNGDIRWMRNTMVAHHDATGRLVSYDGIVEDITERKRAEQARQQTESLYLSLVENLPVRIFRKNLEGRFVYANQAFCAALGLTLSELAGKTDFDLFPQGLAWKYRKDDVQVIKQGKPFHGVEEHEDVDGVRRIVEVVKTPVRDDEGAIIAVQGTFWDITERHESEVALRRAHDETESRVVERTNDLRRTCERLQADLTAAKQREQVLEDSEGRLRAVFEATPAVVVVTDRVGSILEANPVALRAFSTTFAALKSRRLEEVLPAAGGPIPRDCWSEALEKTAPVYRHSVDGDRTYDTRCWPLRDMAGAVFAWIIFARVEETRAHEREES